MVSDWGNESFVSIPVKFHVGVTVEFDSDEFNIDEFEVGNVGDVEDDNDDDVDVENDLVDVEELVV